MMQRHWKCTKCLGDYLFNLRERMQHEVECDENKTEPSTSRSQSHKSDDRLSLKTEYFCDICKINLKLSSIEILKHKKSHLNDK